MVKRNCFINYRYYNFTPENTTRYWQLLTLFLLLICAGSFALPYHVNAKENMNGIYILPAGGKGIESQAARAPFVTGYSIRVAWKALEPVKGQFNWQPVDNIIELAKKNGKYVTLRILAGIDSPKWIMDDPNIPKLKFISQNPNKAEYFNKPVVLPKLWDNNYLKEYYRFLEVVAKRYSNEPLLYWVAVSGPVAGAACPMLPKQQETVKALEEQGFTRENWRRVWEEAIDRTAQAFPKKSISLCLDVPVFYPELADQLAAYAVNKYGHRICLQSNGLSGKVFTVAKHEPKIDHFLNIFRQYADKSIIGFQMTWAAAWRNKGRDRLGPLDQAIDAGIKLNASYLEIYQDDIIDSANAAILSDASKKLGATVKPATGGKAIDSNKGNKQTTISIEGNTRMNLKNVLLELNLTREQKLQVKEIMQQTRQEEQNKDRQKIIDQIRGVLTETQRQEFDRLLMSR